MMAANHGEAADQRSSPPLDCARSGRYPKVSFSLLVQIRFASGVGFAQPFLDEHGIK